MGVTEKIYKAYRLLLKNDSYLLSADVNERSITHQLAVYLAEEFPEYDVDCEYNRNGLNPKRLKDFIKTIKSDDTEGATVYPDIIIHHRGTEKNFIVIEAKKSSNSDNSDKEKLKAFKSELKYEHAFDIKFPVKNDLNVFSELIIEDYIKEIIEHAG